MAGIVHIFHAGRRGYRQRVHTERPKPLQLNTTEELYNRFGFGLDDINYIADLVRPQLQCRALWSHALTVEEQVLIALRCYACGTFYQAIADSMGVHRTAVGEVVTAVSDALARLLDHFVTFPTDGQIAKVKQKFFLLGDMPNTIMVIDCTHVHIQAPPQREWEYVTRKGRHSINVQLVGDADLAITNCDGLGQSTMHESPERAGCSLNSNQQAGWSYISRQCLPTPTVGDDTFPLTPNTPSQMHYNNAHGRTRCAIERLNGKYRWLYTLSLSIAESPSLTSMIPQSPLPLLVIRPTYGFPSQ